MNNLPPASPALPRAAGGQPEADQVSRSVSGNSIKGGFKHLGVKATGLKGTWAAFIKENNND